MYIKSLWTCAHESLQRSLYSQNVKKRSARGSRPETSEAHRMQKQLLSVSFQWNCIKMYLPLWMHVYRCPFTIMSAAQTKPQREVWDKWSYRLWCSARWILLSIFIAGYGRHLCLPAGTCNNFNRYSKQHVALWEILLAFTHVWNIYCHITNWCWQCVWTALRLLWCVFEYKWLNQWVSYCKNVIIPPAAGRK